MNTSPAQPHPSQSQPLARRLAAELFGTFALTLVACGVETVAALHPELSHAERAVAPALMVLALIYAISDVSGAHINPAVTFSFALRGVFEWARVPGYWAAQFVGAVAAALTIQRLVGSAGELGATLPKAGASTSCAVEALLTLLLVSIILHTSKRHAVVGTQAAIAVGATIAMCGMWGAPLSGASMNPARSFGPALLSRHLDSYWVYVIGPMAGGAAAVVLAHLIHGPVSPDEVEAAEGDGEG